MTTEQTRRPPGAPSGARSALVRAAVVCAVGGLAASVVGIAVGGSAAGLGALAGTAFVLGILASGAFAVQYVARVMPAASLIVALVTYTLQVAVMALLFVVLSGSGVLDGPLDRSWFAGTIIGGTAVWLVAQVVATTRERIPVYDLAEPGR